MPELCLNCNLPVEKSFSYCPNCSQKTRLHPLSISHVISESFHFFTHADKSFLLLLKHLALRTGSIAREFVEGKRKKYFPPLNFFLIVAAIFVLVMGFVSGSSSIDNAQYNETNISAQHNDNNDISGMQIRKDLAVRFMNKYANIIGFIAVPLICFIYWLFYRNGRYNYTEHLVACMYMSGFTNLVYALILVPIGVVSGLSSSQPVLILGVFQLIYNSVFYYNFIGKRSGGAAFKASITSLIAILIWFTLSGALVGLYIRNAFWGIL